MYSITSYNGADLPEKTLCLTYDDGPGNYTPAIADFLQQEGIQATFFVVGKYAFHHTDILLKLKETGHLVANHTYDHPEMPYFTSENGDVPNQVLKTDAVIRKYIDSDTVYFRSPYGTWSAEVANELNTNLLSSLNHVGPIHWDVAGVDCYFWELGRSVDEAVDAYLGAIREKKSGIVVMHDDIADMDFVKPRNNTLELTKRLIPLLKKEGYRFVRLDQVSSIKRASEEVLKINLKAPGGKCIALSEMANAGLHGGGKGGSPLSELTVTDAGYGKLALKAANGLYLNLQEGNKIGASGESVTDSSTFDWMPISANKGILRAKTGYFLTNNDGRLMADARYMRKATHFSFAPVNFTAQMPMSLKSRVMLWTKRIRYIKSKLLPAE